MRELDRQELEDAVSEIEFGGLTEEQEQELQRRLVSYREDPDGSTVSLDEALSQVRLALERARG